MSRDQAIAGPERVRGPSLAGRVLDYKWHSIWCRVDDRAGRSAQSHALPRTDAPKPIQKGIERSACRHPQPDLGQGRPPRFRGSTPLCRGWDWQEDCSVHGRPSGVIWHDCLVRNEVTSLPERCSIECFVQSGEASQRVRSLRSGAASLTALPRRDPHQTIRTEGQLWVETV